MTDKEEAMMRITPLILCGGAGTRLWPASREARPKQFLPLFGKRSTFQQTLERVRDTDLFTSPLILTNREHRFLVIEQMQDIGIEGTVVLEPFRQDSGPAIAAGAALVQIQNGEEALVLVLAADHVVTDPEGFRRCCREAVPAAMQGAIVTFGMMPDRPATGYGYICPGEMLEGASPVCHVTRFVEKPDSATAARYIGEGYVWNSGNFLFRADSLIEDYTRFDEESVSSAKDAALKARKDLDFLLLDETAFAATPPRSIDYAVMEKTARAAVLPASFGWSDVGSWGAVWELSSRNEQGNALSGPVHVKEARNNLVLSDHLTTALVGVENLAVIVTQDAVLVGQRDAAAALKALVGELKTERPDLTENGARVYRPWGNYQSLDMGERHQVKRIVVNPGGRLSLQKHHHRSEHWVVVRGTALVTVNDSTKMLHENESVYIPIGAIHRLENPGKIALEIIEVQTGSYLGEDDIIRIEDVYNRQKE
jgi:mannose-1-phosphate guanylyltransferase / mannose-6-phosphate isomerase